MTIDLDRIEALCAAATPGAWESFAADDGSFTIEASFYVAICWRDDWSDNAAESIANAALIAAARTDLPALAAECRRLLAALTDAVWLMELHCGNTDDIANTVIAAARAALGHAEEAGDACRGPHA